MFLLDDTLVYSASDLAHAATCEFSLLRALDAALGRCAPTDTVPDPMLERASALGDAHEQRTLHDFLERFGDGVAIMPRPAHTAAGYAAAAAATLAAIGAGKDVVYQGTFFDGRFVGFCDFLVRQNDTYAVYDTKLSRNAKIPALLQLAAYADALAAAGVPVSPDAHLLLGDGTDSVHPVADIVPVFALRRAHLQKLVDDHHRSGAAVAWGGTGHVACGRCAACEPEVSSNRDLLLVAGMRATQRARLIAGGVTTVDGLAAREDAVPGIAARTYASLRAQALAQLEQERTGSAYVEVFAPNSLGALPKPDAGDIFFDFEGDPLWCTGDSPDWGLEYLFGVVERTAQEPVFRPFWAHDRAEERRVFTEFLDYLTDRRRQYPNMHVYHYAAYEKSALLRLAGRHGVGEEIVDDLLRAGVLVDLYPVVRASLRIGAQSYSIKKLEPLYTTKRDGDVTDAAASVVAYADYCDRRDAGDVEAAAEMLAGIASYNRDDCVSTLLLRDWLLARADEHGVATTDPVAVAETDESTPDPVESALREFAGVTQHPERSDDQQAVALMAASLGYHRRERKPFWWAHFDRLCDPADEWSDTRDTLVATSATLLDDWHKATPRQRKLRRNLRFAGEFGTGSTVGPGTTVYLLYDAPVPDGLPDGGPGTRGWSTGTVVTRDVDNHFHDVLVVEETLPTDSDEYTQLPMAITPGPPIRTTSVEAAIAAAADEMCETLPILPATAAVDVLRRVPPRTRSTAGLPAAADGDHAAAITAALLDLDDSYIAVQGPPGTGKTYTGARVVAGLALRHGWRIGVVAQSHSVVENMLDGIIDAGVPGASIAKAKARKSDPAWTAVPDAKALARFLEHAVDGCVVGGTAWDFTNLSCFEPGGLDLLVIDEAGQFCLANTVAVARAARKLLLLGDPQQLPQVSQGTHPEPADTSALGWLAAGHGALPADRGYFLSRTWRMHPALCARVSDLSYEGRLLSQENVTAARSLDGVLPGVSSVLVEHHGNSTESVEEAAEITRRIAALLGTPWRDPEAFGGARPLAQGDVLVVAPYNAQVIAIRERLAAAGLSGIDVGTVDRFQGRQAAVVFVSMTASAHEEVPRGMSFLLSRNRLNVALSRGKWHAVVVHSPALTRYLPSTPEGLTELGAFLRLTR
ncbi:TM0106 family RecB-like putative nuclease [Rhodococcus zopfii]|uniref:TM0106 family RecB-like putative nuclease n=1 Tax=Rhodococcus zopfii TaxID=43772 RepID=UPI00111149B1|nr:bifunctional RecB family nuclease/DEAD/DEAH box helicase [Rhodococcus zopfii]